MKLIRLFMILCVLNIFNTLIKAVKVSSSTKTNTKLQSATKLLTDLKNFNAKAENFKNGKVIFYVRKFYGSFRRYIN